MMEETNADNELIASFMGFKYYPHPLLDSGWRKEKGHLKIPTYYLCRVTKDMRYKTSWDWLMPVVEKIEGLGYMFSIAEKEAFTCHNENNTDGDFECVSKSKIASAHYVAVKFIKWYNNQKHTSC